MSEPSLYDWGLERDEKARGYAVFGGAEGETPEILAFFYDETDAQAFCEAKDKDGERLVGDPGIALAIVDEGGIWASNDYTDKTHEDLQKRVHAFKAVSSLVDRTFA